MSLLLAAQQAAVAQGGDPASLPHLGLLLAAGALTGQTNESVALTDSQAAQADFAATRAETVALADSQTSALVTSVAQAESVALADSQTARGTYAGAAAESVALADTQTATAVVAAAQAESLALADSQTSTAVFAVAQAESVALADSQDATIVAAGINQVTESFGIGASQTASVAAGLADAVTGGWGTYPFRPKRSRPERAEETAEQSIDRLAAAQASLLVRQALRKAEQRDQAITAQLRDIYAEQDALAMGIAEAQQSLAEQLQDDDDLSMILALAS